MRGRKYTTAEAMFDLAVCAFVDFMQIVLWGVEKGKEKLVG